MNEQTRQELEKLVDELRVYGAEADKRFYINMEDDTVAHWMQKTNETAKRIDELLRRSP